MFFNRTDEPDNKHFMHVGRKDDMSLKLLTENINSVVLCKKGRMTNIKWRDNYEMLCFRNNI